MAMTIVTTKMLGLVMMSIITACFWEIAIHSSDNNNTSGRFPSAAAFSAVKEVPSNKEDNDDEILETTKTHKKTKPSESESMTGNNNKCKKSSLDRNLLEDPCQLDASISKAPDRFSLVFPTPFGEFTAECSRDLAPLHVDRVYKLALHGYYNDNAFFRVIPNRYVQFGTNGNPSISNVYNYTSTTKPECSILDPQPPYMTYCMATNQNPPKVESDHCDEITGLSNDFGTISMSTSYQKGIGGYPNGVTWNATAELFINIGKSNQFLDGNLFVPICTISKEDMEESVMKFPSFGEVAELGGNGPSLGRLYQEGNSYIESNPEWKSNMAFSGTVRVCTLE